MNSRAISQRVRAARQEAGLTQKEFADYLGVHYRTIENFERGKIGRRALPMIAVALDMPPEWWQDDNHDGHANGVVTADEVSALRAQVSEMQETLARIERLLNP